VLRNSADRIPVTLILLLTLVDFVLYLTVDNLWVFGAYFLVTLIPKGCICAWNHHHQHTRTFKATPWNRLLEISYALHTGVTTNLWLLHHVLGHHHNYLDQDLDQSRWKRADGTEMGMWEYTLIVAGTAYYRGYLVGKAHPKHYRTHLIYTIAVIALVTALLVYRPLAALMIFVLPMITGLLITAWATYEHHAGLDEPEDHFLASYNNINPIFNIMTGNLGYHTAHHYRQGTHWSELPRLHKTIQDNIPAQMYKTSFWEYLNRPFFLRLLGMSS
jgi:fatty acid desaturase